VGAGAMLRWRKSESSGIREGHGGEDSTRCVVGQARQWRPSSVVVGPRKLGLDIPP
jgi:hypothetical protein